MLLGGDLHSATKSLVEMGFKNVAHVEGGFDALRKSWNENCYERKKNNLFTSFF